MQETIFYMGLQVSKQFDLEKEWLTIDNYYDSILYLVRDYITRGYNATNKGLLGTIDDYINDNLDFIKITLINYYVSETKDWS